MLARSPNFSLPVYLVIICALSWPMQIAYLLLGPDSRPLLLISMLMAGVGTWIAGRFVFRDDFKNAGWHPGRWYYYALAGALALFLWLFPVMIEHWFNLRPVQSVLSPQAIAATFIVSVVLTVVPAFGEEFSWRGYLLPRLLQRHSPRKALLVHGSVTWFWHLPFLIASALESGGNALLMIFLVVVISFIPTVMHAIVFAWFWQRSASLFVATAYHVAFDEVRDTVDSATGLGVLSANWQILVLTFLGAWLLWRYPWRQPVQ